MANSRPWKLTAPAPVGRVVAAEDHVNVKIDLPPLLPPERTGQLLSGVLRRRGFGDGDGGRLVRERGGVTVTVDPADGSVEVRAEAEQQLPPDKPNPCTCRALDRVREAEAGANDLQRQVTRRLAGALARLGCELEGISAEVTRQALKEKAAQMGEVKEVTEDPKTGTLTVVVEV
jgi:FtsH ternary system domain X5